MKNKIILISFILTSIVAICLIIDIIYLKTTNLTNFALVIGFICLSYTSFSKYKKE